MSASVQGSVSVDPSALVGDCADLVSLPEVAARVVGLVEDPRTTAAQLADVIARDPNLTMRLLRIANSSYYSRRGGIDSISRAVTVLGNRQVRDLTLGISAVRTFSGIPIEVISMSDFWVHSLYCAILARQLASQRDRSAEDAAFVGGLLHDVGDVVLFMRLPDESCEAMWLAMEGPEGTTSDEAEREVIGVDHAAVGAELARRWRLPSSLTECIAFHHRPREATMPNALTVAIVHVANSLAYCAETNCADLAAAPPIDPVAARLAGFEERFLPDLVQQGRAGLDEARALFGL